MKKEYQRPTAQKVSFVYDRVTASSSCWWQISYAWGGEGCDSHSPDISLRSLACTGEGGWWVDNNT